MRKIVLGLLMIIVLSCTKDETFALATLTTETPSFITAVTASSGGIIDSDGGSDITNKGVVWNTSTNPTIDLKYKTTDGFGVGYYPSRITGLRNGTKYYLRAYATNKGGTAYGNEVIFTTLTIIDLPSVAIGSQIWTTKNLDVTTYRDGTVIPQVTDPAQWQRLGTGAWCYQSNNSANDPTYGKLYNWYAVNDPRGLAPVGYHIPSDAEWNTLTNHLGGISVAGGKMKEIGISHWESTSDSVTNESGFLGLPGGYRYTSEGAFTGTGSQACWWTSTTSSCCSSYNRCLYSNSSVLISNSYYQSGGLSVRCIKD